MSNITFNQWGFGLDLRKGPSTSDANRLRVLRNAYITDGKTIRKRPGCVKIATLAAGTVGLFAGLGKLNTFQSKASTLIVHAGALLLNNGLTPEAAEQISSVEYCDSFNGFLYVVATHAAAPTPTFRHHYLDGAPDTRITDVNCPRTPIATKAASKMWAGNGDVVRFCKTNAPRDWTLANDAGFLPVGLQQSGSRDCTALGNYQNKLVAFFADSAQIWLVDPNPVNHKYLQQVDIGTLIPYGHQNMAGDVFYVSPAGVRSIVRQADVLDNLVDSDVGSPIDAALLAGKFTSLITGSPSINKGKAQYFRGAGQYWFYGDKTALVYTFSRSSKISAWSVYDFPFTLDYIDELDTLLYIRSGDNVYRMDRAVWADDGVNFQVEAETSFVDFQSPGIIKMVHALDAVTTGSGDFSHRYDPRSPTLETSPPVTINGDTRPGNRYPVELMSTNMATVVRNLDNKEFELHSITYSYENLGPL